MNKIEVIIDAIGRLNGCFQNPESAAYVTRNPLLLKSFAAPGKHEVTPEGVRIFKSMLAGYKAAVFDVELKIKGSSRSGIKPTDSLHNLLGCYGVDTKVGMDHVVSFLRRALKNDALTVNTTLDYFLT